MNSEFAMLPINSLLFPYGQLRLAFYEPSFIAIARESLANKQPFVLACIDPMVAGDPDFPSGEDLAEVRDFAMRARVLPIASAVEIVDYEIGNNNMLMLILEARHRVFIEERPQRADKVRICNAELIANPAKIAPQADFNLFVELLSKTFDDIKLSNSAKPKLDDAFWILGRMVELLDLPIDLQLKLINPQNPNQALQLMLDSLISKRVERS